MIINQQDIMNLTIQYDSLKDEIKEIKKKIEEIEAFILPMKDELKSIRDFLLEIRKELGYYKRWQEGQGRRIGMN